MKKRVLYSAVVNMASLLVLQLNGTFLNAGRQEVDNVTAK